MIFHFFSRNHGYFALGSQKKRKFLMSQGHRFAAYQCTCCGTLVCRGTAVGNHWSKVLLSDESTFQQFAAREISADLQEPDIYFFFFFLF